MFKFNGMPYKRSGRAGGKSVSMIGMLVLLLAALLVLPSCFDDDEVEVEVETIICNGVEVADRNAPECQAAEEEDDYLDATGGTAERDFMGSDDSDMLAGDDEADYIDGGPGDDSLKGMGGDDSLKGNDGDDTIYGDGGDDVLDGGAGDDTLDGGAGNDELTGGSGDNMLDGGEGEDIAIYKDAMRVVVSLSDGKARVQHVTADDIDPLVGEGDDGTGTDTLANIENVKGSLLGDDIIDGDGNANLLKGLDGADTINGHGGDDTILPNRPVEMDDMGVAIANTAAGATPQGTDGVDVVDGGDEGDDGDTINYEGESAGVTVDLSDMEEATGANTPDDPSDDVIAHVGATVAGGVTDMIKVVNISTDPDDPNIVSTIENVTGGFGADMLTGDARANTLTGGAMGDTLRGEGEDAMTGGDDVLDGGAGGDMLYGGPGADTLMGGPGADTLNGDAGNDRLIGGAGRNTLNGGPGDDYYAVVVGDLGTVTEDANEGMDTLHYVAQADNDETDADESKTGASVTTPANVEITLGTPNDDSITAHPDGATILGREGNDTLIGGAEVDVLVGCDGENTLTGGGESDVFGVFNDGTNADTIMDFNTGADMATTDEIHLKGFEDGAAVTVGLIPGNSTHAGVLVDGDLVAIVTSSTINRVQDSDPNMDGDQTVSKVQGIINALGKNDAVQMVEFKVDKCSSN